MSLSGGARVKLLAYRNNLILSLLFLAPTFSFPPILHVFKLKWYTVFSFIQNWVYSTFAHPCWMIWRVSCGIEEILFLYLFDVFALFFVESLRLMMLPCFFHTLGPTFSKENKIQFDLQHNDKSWARHQRLSKILWSFNINIESVKKTQALLFVPSPCLFH